MTRIVCLSDTHIGCGEHGFKRQPRYLDRLDALYDALRRWLDQTQPDLLVHAGDVTDHGTEPEIAEALEVFGALGVPTAMCLGNHDLCELQSITWWRDAADGLIAGGEQEVMRISLPHCDVLLLTHHWRPSQPYHWVPDEPQKPRIDERQEAELGQRLAASSRPAILVSHAPAHAISSEQTGMDEPVHVPHPPYVQTLRRVARAHPNLRLVLSGHNHTHSVHDDGSFVSCSTAAFNERPAELRLIDVDDEAIHVRTVGLAQDAGLPNEIEPEQRWGIGGEGHTPHRRFSVPVTAAHSTGGANR